MKTTVLDFKVEDLVLFDFCLTSFDKLSRWRIVFINPILFRLLLSTNNNNIYLCYYIIQCLQIPMVPTVTPTEHLLLMKYKRRFKLASQYFIIRPIWKDTNSSVFVFTN